MKKLRFILLISLNCLFLTAQKVYYKPLLINQCTNQIDTSLFTIRNSNGFISENNRSMRIVELPDTGLYEIYWHSNLTIPDNFRIDKYGLTTDTFLTQKVWQTEGITDPPDNHYYCCEGRCNGEFIDYYHDGNIRLIGKFIDGIRIDTLKEYYHNGNLKRIYSTYKKTYKFRNSKYQKFKMIEYYEDGNQQRIKDSKNQIEKEFFPNNILSSEYRGRKDKFNYTVYSENGMIERKTTNNSKTEYYSDGKLMIKMHKHELFAFKLLRLITNSKYKLSKYYFEEYDSTGILNKKGKFVSNNNYFPTLGFPSNSAALQNTELREIIYNTNPQTKEVYSGNVFDSKDTVIITNYKLTNRHWVKISSRKEIKTEEK